MTKLGRMKKNASVPVRCCYTRMEDPQRLKPNPRNPNHHPEEQLELYQAVILKQGWRRAIVVSKRSGFIVMGHGAREVALRIGCQVPVDVQDFKDEKEEHAQMLADNQIPELSEFDAAAAFELLQEFPAEELGGIGFTQESVEELAEAIEQARGPVSFKEMKVKAPPKMAWVLIGIPLVRFSEINADIERIAGLADTTVESTVNDGTGKLVPES
jgi:hypothetical protein